MNARRDNVRESVRGSVAEPAHSTPQPNATRPTATLKAEHDAISTMLLILESVCTKLKAGDDVPAQHLNDIVEFIRVYADRRHPDKEEGLLLKAMVEEGVPSIETLNREIVREHEMGREYVGAMSTFADAYPEEDRQAVEQFTRTANRYVALMRRHIENENAVLFPMADRYLSPQRHRALEEQFSQIDQSSVGVSEGEKMHRFLRDLGRIYLK